MRRELKEESKREENKGTTYYNLCFKNCQHFACDIEKILFGDVVSENPLVEYNGMFGKLKFSNNK